MKNENAGLLVQNVRISRGQQRRRKQSRETSKQREPCVTTVYMVKKVVL